VLKLVRAAPVQQPRLDTLDDVDTPTIGRHDDTARHTSAVSLQQFFSFYARKQLLLSARLSHHDSVCPSVRPSVRYTGGSVKNGASYDHRSLTVGCLEDSLSQSRRNGIWTLHSCYYVPTASFWIGIKIVKQIATEI